MTNNWLTIHHQFSQDLESHEILLVGESKSGPFKWTDKIACPISDVDFSNFIRRLDNALGMDAAPKK